VLILVTGAGGSLGKATVKRLLERGHRVRGFVLFMPEHPHKDVEYVVGNLGDPAAVARAVAGVEVVIHAGAVMKGTWAEHKAGTVDGTQNVVDACKAHRVKQLVHISSMSVVDWAGSDNRVVNEETALEPRPNVRGFYTRAKLEAERIVRDAAAGGLPAVIFRPGQIFGGGIPLITGAVARDIRGRWLVLGDGTLSLPLVYIDDVVDAIVGAVDQQVTGGEVIQIIDPESLTQNQVLALAGGNKPVLRIPRSIVFALGKLKAGYRLESALARLQFKSERARQRLGWSPRVGVREGIRRATHVNSTRRTEMKKQVVIIGAGLCGSVLSALLRDDFEVTVIERGQKKKPLFDDVDCDTGELNTSINRAEGLGGTTNYWHNALIELDDKDLRKAGIDPSGFAPYYRKAWQFFLSQSELDACDRVRDTNAFALQGSTASIGHMVLPQTRHNAWKLANDRYPGAAVNVVYGKVTRIVDGGVEVQGSRGTETLRADHVIVCAGGIGTPILLASSLGKPSSFVSGYHDHPMAYVAKLKLRPDSRLKAISSTATLSADVRAGLVYECDDLKTVVYLRPAVDMRLGSIMGPARYILSDLRNDPFSPKKIRMLLGNLEAVREAILFKTRLGFRGSYYSMLILGEQTPLKSRGVQMTNGGRPSLNWHVTPDELRSYEASVYKFLTEFTDDILEYKLVPTRSWEFRNAAHHSGTATSFLAAPGDTNRDFFAVRGLPNTYVCDGSILRAAGIANSGLTLVALAYRLAELVRAEASAPAQQSLAM